MSTIESLFDTAFMGNEIISFGLTPIYGEENIRVAVGLVLIFVTIDKQKKIVALDNTLIVDILKEIEKAIKNIKDTVIKNEINMIMKTKDGPLDVKISKGHSIAILFENVPKPITKEIMPNIDNMFANVVHVIGHPDIIKFDVTICGTTERYSMLPTVASFLYVSLQKHLTRSS
ncbi:hypothetical protein HAP94_05110 [Acidithiobacillus ferrivorans]|nr:hypothetical protein [Acidithiobacillus ferrivorans]